MPRVTQIRSSSRYLRRRTIVLDDCDWRTTSAAVVRALALAPGDEVDLAGLAARLASAEAEAMRERALRLLTYREHSVAELLSKLTDDGYPHDQAQTLTDDLQRVGLVDDARFAASLASTLVSGRGLGRRRALAEMARHGLDDLLATEALDALAPADGEDERALVLARHWAPRVSDARKLAAKLIRRGFSPRASFSAASVALHDEGETPHVEP